MRQSCDSLMERGLLLYIGWAVFSGWMLSAMGELNAYGYAVMALGGGGLFWIARKGWAGCGKSYWRKIARRWRRPLPAIFTLYAVISLVGGAIHPPNNYDYLTYRFSRMIHWWAEGGWHWIPSFNLRMNLSGTTDEWALMPMFIFTHSDRLFYLLHWAAFCLMPGCVFAVAWRLGVARRLAWVLMWLLPCGYCYALQAGSTANDLLGAWLFLVALAMALRGGNTFAWKYFAPSCLAAALMTGVKASNLPLLLPVALALAPAVLDLARQANFGGEFFRSKVLPLIGLGALGLMFSFFPIAVANQLHTGSWKADIDNASGMEVTPLVGLEGNILEVIADTATPPLFPFAQEWNRRIIKPFLQGPGAPLLKDFPFLFIESQEMPTAEGAGIGFGIGWLWLITAVCLPFLSAKERGRKLDFSPLLRIAIFAGGVVAMAVYAMKLGSSAGARLLTPFYILPILALFALPSARGLVRSRLWMGGALLAALSLLPAMILTPSRPLIPVQYLTALASAARLPASLTERIKMVYETYDHRNDVLGPVREALPPHTTEVGWLATGDDTEVALWRPFGSRKVVHLVNLRAPALPTVIVTSRRALFDNLGVTDPQSWIAEMGYHILAQKTLLVKVSSGTDEFFVLGKNEAPQ